MRRATGRRERRRQGRQISIHALHEESDSSGSSFGAARSFQSTLSMRRATLCADIARRYGWTFQSTLSMRRATDPLKLIGSPRTLFQSTLSMRRATFATPQVIAALNVISIHALHEESDLTFDHYYPVTIPISIHALHEESDSAAGHFCPLFETQASCLALSISNNTADTTNNMSKTSNWLSVSF